MTRYAMKAYAGSHEQMQDRINKFKTLNLKPFMELHLISLDDMTKNRDVLIANCAAFAPSDYQLHFPIQDSRNNYIFDPYRDETPWIEIALDVCVDIGARTMVTHRCCGFDQPLGRREAQERFFQQVSEWDRLARERNVKILIENYGFIWLPASFKKKFIASALDHFFPWEIKDFLHMKSKCRWDHTEVLLDTAHATLSSNMFNMCRSVHEIRKDPRFKNIYQEDLDQTAWLEVKDFILKEINHFHISDAFVWSVEDSTTSVEKFLYEESLPLGEGTIPYHELLSKFKDVKSIVMEINPKDGNHNDNQEQLQAIQYFMRLYDEGVELCV